MVGLKINPTQTTTDKLEIKNTHKRFSLTSFQQKTRNMRTFEKSCTRAIYSVNSNNVYRMMLFEREKRQWMVIFGFYFLTILRFWSSIL